MYEFLSALNHGNTTAIAERMSGSVWAGCAALRCDVGLTANAEFLLKTNFFPDTLPVILKLCLRFLKEDEIPEYKGDGPLCTKAPEKKRYHAWKMTVLKLLMRHDGFRSAIAEREQFAEVSAAKAMHALKPSGDKALPRDKREEAEMSILDRIQTTHTWRMKFLNYCGGQRAVGLIETAFMDAAKDESSPQLTEQNLQYV